MLLVGSAHKHNYPLRSRFMRLHHAGQIIGALQYKPDVLEGTPQVGEVSLAATTNKTGRILLEKQIRKYARALGRSKIVLVTVSVNNYLLRKYMEAALSGACQALNSRSNPNPNHNPDTNPETEPKPYQAHS